MRTLALTIFAFNVTYGAAWGVLVLYAQRTVEPGTGSIRPVDHGRRRLEGVVRTLSYTALERRVSLGNIMRVGPAGGDIYAPRSSP